ncbi:L1 protein [Papillomaviridae sp. Haddock_c145]|nr:L1 protein [Papillomaviridae sp. Haddock_c145]
MHRQPRGLPVTSEYAVGGIVGAPYVLTTDKFVNETEETFIVESDLIQLQGHPYQDLAATDKLPKLDTINPSRFNIVELTLPDLNKEMRPVLPGNMSMRTRFKVWKVEAIRVDIQGSVHPAVSGATATSYESTPMMIGKWDKQGESAESADMEEEEEEVDGLKPVPVPTELLKTYISYEHALRQRLVVGCEPPLGVYQKWDQDTRVFKRISEELSDGDLGEFGYGNLDVINFGDHTYTPVDMRYEPDGYANTYLLDKLAMDSDQVGDRSFMCIERCQTGIKHTMQNWSKSAENSPWEPDKSYYETDAPDPWSSVTSGVYTLQGDIFNRNYWLHQSRNPNNGICFKNKLHVTFQDNLRGQIDRVTKAAEHAKLYKPDDFYLRHSKEFKVVVIVRECWIDLEGAFINEMLRTNHEWLENFGFNFGEGGHPSQVKQGQFNMISHEAPLQKKEVGEGEPEIVKTKKYIQMDCNGSVRMQNTEHSNHTLAVSHRAMRPPKGAPVQVTAGRKATAKRKK